MLITFVTDQNKVICSMGRSFSVVTGQKHAIGASYIMSREVFKQGLPDSVTQSVGIRRAVRSPYLSILSPINAKIHQTEIPAGAAELESHSPIIWAGIWQNKAGMVIHERTNKQILINTHTCLQGREKSTALSPICLGRVQRQVK